MVANVPVESESVDPNMVGSLSLHRLVPKQEAMSFCYKFTNTHAHTHRQPADVDVGRFHCLSPWQQLPFCVIRGGFHNVPMSQIPITQEPPTPRLTLAAYRGCPSPWTCGPGPLKAVFGPVNLWQNYTVVCKNIHVQASWSLHIHPQVYKRTNHDWPVVIIYTWNQLWLRQMIRLIFLLSIPSSRAYDVSYRWAGTRTFQQWHKGEDSRTTYSIN